MTGPGNALRIAFGGALAGAFGLAHVAFGQDNVEPVGPRAVLDYSIGVDVDTNKDLDDPSEGTYSALINAFDFSFLSNTRNQSLAFNFGTDLRYESNPAQEDSGYQFDWQDPAFDLRYTREAANARFAFSSNFSQRDVDTTEPFFVDLNGDTIIDQAGFSESQGTLTQIGAAATLDTGLYAPIGTTYTASYQSRTYSDTDDPDLNDRLAYRFATTTRLRFSEVSTGLVDLSFNQYEYSSGRVSNGDSASISFGLARQLSPILALEASLGYSKLREEERIDGSLVPNNNEGLNGSAGFTRELSNGSFFGLYDRQLVEDEFRNSLTFGRNISMPNYELRASAGVTNLDGGDLQPTFGVFYTRELEDARFTASLRRTVTLNTDDEERTLTSAIIGYRQQINEVSSVNLGLDYAFVTSAEGEEGDGSDDETRATFLASYSHALTREWDVNVGYRARSRTQESEDAFSNAVFVSVGRRFILRP